VQSTPQASFNFNFDGNGFVDVTHEGGDRLQAGDNTKYVNVTSTDGGTAVWVAPGGSAPASGYSAPSGASGNLTTSVGAGTTYNDYAHGGNGATVRVTWTGENGQSTATLSSAQAP
jgi:hypothetical protein